MFDEDISEVGSHADAAEEEEDDDESDIISEHSYDGSHAFDYYDLKERRETRKRVLKQVHEEKKLALDMARKREHEVRAAHAAIEYDFEVKGHKFPLDLGNKSREYELFCAEHVEYCFTEWTYGTKRLDLDTGELCYPGDEAFRGQFVGQIYLDSGTLCQWGPFEAPCSAAGELLEFKITAYENSVANDSVSIRFLDDHYVIVSVSKNFILSGMRDARHRALDSAPKVFTFYGVLRAPFERRKQRVA